MCWLIRSRESKAFGSYVDLRSYDVSSMQLVLLCSPKGDAFALCGGRTVVLSTFVTSGRVASIMIDCHSAVSIHPRSRPVLTAWRLSRSGS